MRISPAPIQPERTVRDPCNGGQADARPARIPRGRGFAVQLPLTAAQRQDRNGSATHGASGAGHFMQRAGDGGNQPRLAAAQCSELRGQRGAEAQGAGERLRLPHAHLRRRALPARAARPAIAHAGECGRRAVSAAAAAHRHDAHRDRHARRLRDRQSRHARRHRAARRANDARRRGGASDRDRRGAEDDGRRRHSRHPLHGVRSALGRGVDRHDRAARQARRRSRLAHPDPHARRPDRRECRAARRPADAQWCSIISAACRSPRRWSMRPSASSAA